MTNSFSPNKEAYYELQNGSLLFAILIMFNFGTSSIDPIALRKAKTAYYFGLSECNRVKRMKMDCNLRMLIPKQTLQYLGHESPKDITAVT